MPRLSFWLLSTAATAGVSYAGYHFVYEPRQYAQLTEDDRLLRAKQELQDAVHAYALLEAGIDEQARRSRSYAPTAAALRRGDTSAWFTNSDKLLFFCDIQRVRGLLWGLPAHLTTEGDLHRMLRQLTAWEGQHCTELSFRAEPLRFTEAVRSVACFALYVLLFRLVSPLLSRCDGLVDTQAQMLHRGAVLITRSLEIDTAMTTSERREREELYPPTHDTGVSAVTRGCVDGQAQDRVDFLALGTSHWIEEVGFWACPNNPLLRQHLQDQGGSTVAGEGRVAVRLLHNSPLHRISSSADASRPHTTVPAVPTTYAEHWQQLASRRERAIHSTSPPSASLAAVAAAEASLGYPLLSPGIGPLPSGERRYIPVGVSGLPRLLYVDTAHATADVRPRRSKEEVYALHQQAQFARAPGSSAAGAAMAGAPPAIPVGSEAAAQRAEEWWGRTSRGSIAWWRREWWCGVYGGPRRSATGAACTLRYHLGAPSTAAEFVEEALKARRTAEQLAMHAAQT